MNRQRLMLVFLLLLAMILTGLVIEEIWRYHTKQQKQKAQDRIDLFYIDLLEKRLGKYDTRLAQELVPEMANLCDSIYSCLSDIKRGITLTDGRIENILSKSREVPPFNKYPDDNYLKLTGSEHLDGTYRLFLNNPVQLKKHLYALQWVLVQELLDVTWTGGIRCNWTNVEYTFAKRPGVEDSILIFIHENICAPNINSDFQYYFNEEVTRDFTYLDQKYTFESKKFENRSILNPQVQGDSLYIFHIKDLPNL